MYLGLDLGTSGVKALLIDADQKVVGVGHARARRRRGRIRAGPSRIRPTGSRATRSRRSTSCKAAHPAELAAVRGIGLSGQMHGATLLDADDEVLRPCILWNDARSHAEAAELDADPRFRAHHRQHRLSRLHRAEARLGARTTSRRSSRRVAKVLLPKDYLRLWLTGEHVSEMSDAAGTPGSTSAARDWSDELLAATGLDASAHAAPGRRHRRAGHAARRAGRALGHGGGRRRRRRGGRQCRVGLRHGRGPARAQAFVSLGTSGVLFVANDRYLPNPESAVHAFCHALPDTWHQMGVILSATDCAQLAAQHHRQGRRPS